MYLNDDEAEALINHKNNGLVKVKIIGKGNHNNQSHESKRSGEQKRSVEEKLKVAVAANLVGNKLAGLITNTNQTQVSQYSRGLNADGKHDAKLINGIEVKLGKVSEKAADKVDILLQIFSEEKMEELKSAEIPAAAEKLMGVIERIGKVTGKAGGMERPVVIIHAPKQQPLDQYILKEV